MPKKKLNGKLIKTYYDFENMMELKECIQLNLMNKKFDVIYNS